jgi:hypothetical protein
MMADKVLLGNFAVDSGQVMIGDPCYLDDFKNDDYKEDGVQNDYSYSGVCATTTTKENGGELSVNGVSLAVVSSTGMGDGVYPVYAIKENGRIKEITIKFF